MNINAYQISFRTPTRRPTSAAAAEAATLMAPLTMDLAMLTTVSAISGSSQQAPYESLATELRSQISGCTDDSVGEASKAS
mgnify:CR=1 FL=1